MSCYDEKQKCNSLKMTKWKRLTCVEPPTQFSVASTGKIWFSGASMIQFVKVSYKLKQTLCTSYLHAPHKPVKYISLPHVSTSNFCMWKCIVSWCKYYFTLYFSFLGRRQEITRLWSNHDKPGWVPILILKSSKLLSLLRKAAQNILSSVSHGGEKTTTTNDEKLKIVTKNIHL